MDEKTKNKERRLQLSKLYGLEDDINDWMPLIEKETETDKLVWGKFTIKDVILLLENLLRDFHFILNSLNGVKEIRQEKNRLVDFWTLASRRLKQVKERIN